ncbi:MAG: BolA/IbaG family iron-sulfur metabolism protein [Gammaproteobacteria bacterium]|nr:BolA/IbaG family iron-sulfur metabolism protein [Gammaproteobacteria bacterium]
MTPEEVKTLIEAGMPDSTVTVTGDGSKFEAIVVSADFAGKTMVQEQKMVYATVNQEITSGALHALTIKAFTPEEWQQQNA